MRYDEETYNELLRDLAIDKHRLDDETIRQPGLFFHASEGCAFAMARRDKKERDLKITMAELDRGIRDNAQSDGVKITEAYVNQQILREDDYSAAHSAFLDARLEADKWEALKNSFRQRADMLRALVQLYSTNYFGEVTGSSDRAAARQRVSPTQRVSPLALRDAWPLPPRNR